MKKRIPFLWGMLFFVYVRAADHAETSLKKRLQIQFNPEHATVFLKEAHAVISQDRSMIRSLLMQTDDPEKGLYQMQTAGFDFLVQDPQFNEVKHNMEMVLETYIKTIETAKESSPEFEDVIQGIFDTLMFLIAHVRWNMCEIQYDMYRSSVGYHQKIDEDVLNTYAIDRADYEHIVYSAYHKGKFSLLHPNNTELAPLVKYVQYEELSRCHQLYNALQAYIGAYYRIFGENDDTTAFLQKLITLVENQFQEHSKRFTLDHILRFSGETEIGRLLY